MEFEGAVFEYGDKNIIILCDCKVHSYIRISYIDPTPQLLLVSTQDLVRLNREQLYTIQEGRLFP